MKAILMLEDGKTFFAQSLWEVKEDRIGEVIFNTQVVGYQEMLTDPANIDKILVLTYPLIGNYGCAQKFNESEKVWPLALVIKENSRIFSNWQAEESLESFAKRHNLLVLTKVDTRTLTVHLRQKGSLLGVISTRCFEEKLLQEKLAEFKRTQTKDLLAAVSVKKIIRQKRKHSKKVALLDLGLTKSLLRQLEILGAAVDILPYHTSAEEILRLKPDGLILSSGCEDVNSLKKVAEEIKPLLGKLPILGISSGALVLGLALGAKVNRLKLGHRGANYPLKRPTSLKGEISVQNHEFVLDAESLSKIKGLKITAFNLNDHSVEEIHLPRLKLWAAQYLLVSPGFKEVHPFLTKFMQNLRRK